MGLAAVCARMKALHRPDLFSWSTFDTARNVDFHSVAWARPAGLVVFDPLELSAHDLAHLESLGKVEWICITNGEHQRAAAALRERTGAKVAGPAGERGKWALTVDRWLADGEELVPGLKAFALEGSKTPGELAFLLEGKTLITGDLVRGQRGGSLNLLPDPKLSDKARAVASVRRLAELPGVEAVLVGDGWPVFRDGAARLRELVAAAESARAR